MVNANTSWYQYPNSTDSESLLTIVSYLNTTGDGMLFPVLLLVTWVIAFVGSLGFGGRDAKSAGVSFTFASFICSILGILLVILELLSDKFMYLLFILTAVGLLWIKATTPSSD